MESQVNVKNYPPRPISLTVQDQTIPQELIRYDNWMLWSYELRPNGSGVAMWTKPPIQINSNYAKSSDPRTWASFAQVIAHYRRPWGTLPDGIGFRPTEEVVGIDLDHCRDPQTGFIQDWALVIIRLIDSYTELSPSGTGIRIFAYGVLPPGRRKKGNVEMYDKSSPKYLTITGHHLEETPHSVEHRQLMITQVHNVCLGQKDEINGEAPEITPDEPGSSEGWFCPHSLDDIMLAALAAQNGAKFDLLRQGKFQEAGFGSHSEADLAFVAMIAFWTGPDAHTIDAVFRSTQLYRPKWDERRGSQTYGELTIAKGMILDSYYHWINQDVYDDLSDYVSEMPSYVDEETDCRAQDGQTFVTTSGVNEMFAEDLIKREIETIQDNGTWQIRQCPCCGVPGTFVLKDHVGSYLCGYGRRSWVQGRELFKRYRLDDGFTSLSEVLQSPDPEWLIRGHLAKLSTNLTYGPPETAKSIMELGRALTVATGIDYLRQTPTNQGKAVYIYSEGRVGLKRRIKAWLQHYEIREDDPRLKNITFLCKRWNLAMSTHVERLTELIKSKIGSIDLLVIDTLAKNFDGKENESMQQMVNAAEDLRDILQCAVSIVHHVGKDASRGPRGGSQLEAGVDATIEVVGIKSTENENEFVGAKIIPRKLKDGRKLKPFRLDYLEIQLSMAAYDHSIVLVPSDKEVPVTPTAKEALVDVCVDFLLWVPDEENMILQKEFWDLCEDNGMTRNRAINMTRKYVKTNQIRRKKGGKNGWFLYR